MNKKYLAIPIVILMGVMGMLILMSTPLNTPLSFGNNFEEPKMQTNVCVYKNDQLVDCVHNLLVDSGRQLIKNISTGSYLNIVNISIGNCTGTTGAPCVQGTGDTFLNGSFGSANCGLGPATASFINQPTGQWNLSYQWTSTCDSTNVNATGLFNNTGVVMPNMFAEANFSNVQLSNGDRINVTWGFVVPTS